jgi:hypothetical protein
MRSWTRNLCPKPAAVKDIQEPSVKLAERRHTPPFERATMALTTPSGHPALGSSETVVVSATPAAAASRWALGTSEARVRNQLAQPQVSGCCETGLPWDICSACPHLHRRPATSPVGQRPDRCRLLPGVHRDGQRRLHRPPDPGAAPGPRTAMPSRVVRLATTARLVAKAVAARSSSSPIWLLKVEPRDRPSRSLAPPRRSPASKPARPNRHDVNRLQAGAPRSPGPA